MTTTADEQVLVDHAFLSRVLEPGSLVVAAWLSRLEVPEAAAEIRAGRAPEPVMAMAGQRLDTADPEGDLAAAAAVGARLVIPADPDWPHFAFGCLHHALGARLARGGRGRDGGEPTVPIALWVRGRDTLADAAVRSAAVVGSRAATGYGEHVAAEFGHGLAERDVTVVSGGAYGIDGQAHRGALAAGGRTWLVSAGGVERAYPTRHAALYERIADSGLIVSEYPPGCRPLRHRFTMRNRLIAALSCATVVVEAAIRSGALNTVRHAYDLQRPVLAVPGPVTSTMSAGCHLQIRGERPTEPDRRAELVTSVDDVMAFVDGSVSERGAGPADPIRRKLDGLSPSARRVFEGVPRRGWADEMTIAGRAGVTALEVGRALPTLSLAGLVESSVEGHRVARGILGVVR